MHKFCELFHKTMKTECYDILFRRKIYTQLCEIQNDIEQWFDLYNRERHTLENIVMERDHGKPGTEKKDWLRKSNWRIYFTHRLSF
ncbi:hypothetical protein A9G38_00285 [Gilliamella sp. Imp1-1]|nr:hypothetical protein A9G38_00285 [Gilliamella apicola]